MQKITCPKCKFSFELEDIYKQEIETKIMADFESQKNKEIFEIQQKIKQEEEQKFNIEKEKLTQSNNELTKNIAELQQEKCNRKKLELELKEKENLLSSIQAEQETLANRIRIETETKLQEQNSEKIKQEREFYESQLKQKEETIKKQAQEDAQRIAKLEYENKQGERENELQFKHKLKEKEFEEKLSQANKRVEELSKTINQNSTQIQGEAQEKLLTETLQELFIDDKIERKTTGVEESDIKQIVIDKIGYQNTECGIIQYESKNTKTWSNAWIDKLIIDGETAKADILVLVTQTMPANKKELHRVKNVWICPIKDIKIVATTLRQGLIEIHKTKGTQINKADKMEMLFDFMMSPTFKNYIENIYTGINSIKQSYEKERRSLETIWKKREKEFETIILSCTNLIGSIQGIGIKTLEIDALNLKLLSENND